MKILAGDFAWVLCFCVLLRTWNENLGSQTPLETIGDDELVELIKHEKYFVTLFARKDDPKSDEWEKELLKVREDLINQLNNLNNNMDEEKESTSLVVKVVDSQMTKLYVPYKDPVIVFFRHGVPLLYEGPLDIDIVQYFVDNKEPTVKELTDETFEHLTQASSGATTGDWFIMFYSNECVDCQRMFARWETVGARLNRRVNVARINKQTTGASTARRFNVQEVPEFIFFRQGKMYRYQIPRLDVNSLVTFAKEWYKNARAEKVPVPESPFDDLTQMIADFLRSNPWIMKLGSICICVLVIVTTASKLLRKSEAPSQKKDK